MHNAIKVSKKCVISSKSKEQFSALTKQTTILNDKNVIESND